MKKVLCYIALVFLIALIALPPTLRLFVNDNVDIKPTNEDIVELLVCTKNKETLSMSYLNNVPVNIKLVIPNVEGNPLPDESDNNLIKGEIIGDDIVTIKDIVSENNSTNKKVTTDKITYFLLLENVTIDDNFRQGIVEQSSYYTSSGYICNITK